MCSVQFLHVYWFKLIVGMVMELVTHKELSGDTRSDSELSDCTVSTTDYHSNGLVGADHHSNGLVKSKKTL